MPVALELSRAAVETMEPRVCADPQSAVAVLEDLADEVAGQAFGLVGVVGEVIDSSRVPMDTIEPVVRARPQALGSIGVKSVHGASFEISESTLGTLTEVLEPAGLRIKAIEACLGADPYSACRILTQRTSRSCRSRNQDRARRE